MTTSPPNDRAREVHEWLDGLDERARQQVEELIALLRRGDPRVEQAIKWGRLTLTVDGDWHHWVCGIAATRKGVKLVFHKGALLTDPQKILRGSGRYIREVPAATAVGEPETITDLLREAITRQTDMLG
jgi:hypothetical protein